MTAASHNASAAGYIWRMAFGKPHGYLVRLRCWALGHDWTPCDAGCCNRWYCLDCLTFGPTLDHPPPPRWRRLA